MQNHDRYINLTNTVPIEETVYNQNTSLENSIPTYNINHNDRWDNIPVYLPLSNEQGDINITPKDMRKLFYKQFMILSLIGLILVIAGTSLAGTFYKSSFYIGYIFCVPYLSLIINSCLFITVRWLKLYTTIFQIINFFSYIIIIITIVLEVIDILEYSIGQTASISIFTLNIIVAIPISATAKVLLVHEMTGPFINSNPNIN